MLVEFKLQSGATTYLNINHMIPFSVTPSQNEPNVVIVSYPTHNNGGYRVREPYDQVLAKINKALAQ